MNIWHDMPEARVHAERFPAVIEISRGGKVKYELDKETGLLKMDRVLYTSTHYPANYGFIPRTYAEDGDPLDVLVLSTEIFVPLSLVECRPIGVIAMRDDGAPDEKIVAVPLGDPTYNGYEKIEELPAHIAVEMRHFFTVYKQLEGKRTVIESVAGADAAKSVVEKCIHRYREFFQPR
jgi:Inorganic pyrophosphatase